MPKKRASNPRGAGDKLRRDIVEAALSVIEEHGEAETLSLREIARAVGVAATSVYLHFEDRDALLAAVIEEAIARMLADIAVAEGAARDARARLRARLVTHARWAAKHPGLHNVLSESTLMQRHDLPGFRAAGAGTLEAVRACAPADAEAISLDLRVAVHGMISMRLHHPHLSWPPIEEQIDRFLSKLLPARRAKT